VKNQKFSLYNGTVSHELLVICMGDNMKTKKRLALIIGSIVVIALLVIVGLLVSARAQESKIQEHLELGDRYLDELDYERAIAEYMAVLEIDSKCVDAYLGITDAYIAMDDYEQALAYAEEGYNETKDERLNNRIEEIETLINTAVDESGSGTDVVYVEEIIWYSENQKTIDMEYIDDNTIAALEKVPDSSISYVGVGGYGEPRGMGVHFQNYDVGVSANPKEGYRYVRCESDTIEFYQHNYNEYLGYEVPRFLVPESGHHTIYVYYEKITEDSANSQPTIPTVTPEPVEEVADELLEGTSELELPVPVEVEVVKSNGGVIITRKDGLYGAMNYAGEEIVPNIYSTFSLTPNEQGYFALGNEETIYVFNPSGEIKLSDNIKRLIICGDKAFYTQDYYRPENDVCYAGITLYDLSKNMPLYSIGQDYDYMEPYGFVNVVSTEGDFYYTDMSTSDLYKIIISEDGDSSVEHVTTTENTIETDVLEQPVEGTTLFEGNGGTSGSRADRQTDGGYYIWSCFVDGYARGQMIQTDAEILTNPDGTEQYKFNKYQLLNNWNVSDKSYFDNGVWKYNKGKQFVVSYEDIATGITKCHLIDMSYATCDTESFVQNPEAVIIASYDSITLSDSPWYLAGKDGKWFYIDETGKIVHDSYKDYAAFYGGYAVIVDMDGRAYMIDENFNKVAGGYVAEGVHTEGGVFFIEQIDKTVYLTPPTP